MPVVLFVVTTAIIGLQFVAPASVQAQQFPAFPGATFEARRQAYLDNQGAAWKNSFPSAMIHAVWAWLERPKGNERRIDQEIQYYLTHDHDGWKNGWYTGDHRVILPLRWYLQYYLEKKVIANEHATELKERLSMVAGNPNIWGAAPNYGMRYIVTGYLYTYLIEDVGNVHFYQDDTGPKSFTINGRRYIHGKHYPSRAIYRDYLSHTLNGWWRGTGEHFSDPYFYAQIHSFAALADFAPDDELRRKGRMLFDFFIFDWAVGFSANHPAGGDGRTYSHYEEKGDSEFPWVVFFDLYGKPDIQHRNTYADGYVFKHRFPQFLTDLVEQMWKGEGDDFYRLIRGDTGMGHPDSDQQDGSYRYAYVTPNYNLGGAGEGAGWELNIKSDSVPFKLFINRCSKPYDPGCNVGPEDPILFFMGYNGNQHRNALFVHSGGTLQQSVSNPWDEQSTEAGWQFFREGKVAVAVRMTDASSALEVATLGVDYPSFNAFKIAIKTKARLSSSSFTTSKGVAITKGYVDGQLPFDRLEVWEGHVGKNDETKVVSWRNKVMTVSKKGRTCIYDFNTWQTRGNGFEVSSGIGSQ